MALDVARVKACLRGFDFKKLFIEELGWDRHNQTIEIHLGSQIYTLSAVVEKRGLVVFLCIPPDDGAIPEYTIRRQIDRLAAKTVLEHLIIYTDRQRTTQVWQWVKREPGKPTQCREHAYHRDQPGDALIQKLQSLLFSIEEEDQLTLVEVAGRARTAFDVERVTKGFYEGFKDEHANFLKFLKGIPDGEMQRWYVSVMLNRLMFIYFVQKKGFLDNDTSYLRNQLGRSRDRSKDGFYRRFLCPLFFEGFAKKPEERSATTNELLGRIPYLNGGLFMRHQIEEAHGKDIQIADAAFERLFTFFEHYQWHLDDRPLRSDKEINPDVLGYIFEKYINQKQMGAYYTKEDITGYVSQNTVIPCLFDAARQKCKIAFEGEHAIWRLLQAAPDRYIFPAVKHGITVDALQSPPKRLEKPLKLPPEIAAGLEDVSKRGGWNKPAPPEHALPTEIWREVVARRKRYEEVRSILSAGKIQSINDLITYNLDIHQFAQDVIENSEGPELLRAFYHAIAEVTVLDPACGSGAFLFAALNVLEPLYDACLDRVQVFLEELERSGEKHRPEKFGDFKKILARVTQHPNRRYFILKSIIVNNLYGVDIMEEATEICKLRLFLKLVAQVESSDKIEPLPDIDFNIRAGNSLVGYASYDDVKRVISGNFATAVSGTFDFEGAMQKIEERAADVDRLFCLFRQQQTRFGGEVTAQNKQELRNRLKVLEDELNEYLASECGVKKGEKSPFQKWLQAHKPFHWFIQFFGIMKQGGFDVVIGNPPWREYSAVKKEYTVRSYSTEGCGNPYALFAERALAIRSASGWISFIVQLPLASSSRMISLRDLLREKGSCLYLIPFDDRPGKLFEGLEHCRSVIFLSQARHSQRSRVLATTRYQRWPTATREVLFALLQFTLVGTEPLYAGIFPKYAHSSVEAIFNKIKAARAQPVAAVVAKRSTSDFIFYQESTGYWVKASVSLPYYSNNGRTGTPPHGRFLYLDRLDTLHPVCAVLNSSLFYLYFIVFGDCFHLSDRLVAGMPMTPALLTSQSLLQLNRRLMKDLQARAVRKTINTKTGDKISYDEYYAWKSKPLIDEIDRVLAKHYGFTDEELDFIINYDIKYRMGREAEGAED